MARKFVRENDYVYPHDYSFVQNPNYYNVNEITYQLLTTIINYSPTNIKRRKIRIAPYTVLNFNVE